jgi:hypothetical protein
MAGATDPKGVDSVSRPRPIPAPAGTPSTGGLQTPLGSIGGSAPQWYRWSVTHNDGSVEYYQGPTPPDPTTGRAEGATLAGTDTDPDVKKEWDKGESARGEGKVVTGPDGRKYRITGDTMVPLEGQEPRETYRTFPDGSLRHLDPRTGEWVIDATKPQGPVQNEAPTLHTFPDGSLAQWNPGTAKWDVVAAKPKPEPKDEVPELTLPARRPGQTTDLATVKSEADAYRARLQAQVADGTITRAERDRLFDAYYESTVKPKVAAANAEANAEAARVAQQQADAARRQAEADRRATAREDRATALGELEFGQRAGQNAVKNAMDLLHYQVSPTFLREFAAGLGTLSSGGGHVQFSPEAFQINLPDLDALAAQGAQRAAALYHANTLPFTPAGAGAAGPPAPAAEALAGVPMLPPPRTSMPGAANVRAAPAPQGAPAPLPASAGPSQTPGVGAGAPSPLPPDWPWTSPAPPNY